MELTDEERDKILAGIVDSIRNNRIEFISGDQILPNHYFETKSEKSYREYRVRLDAWEESLEGWLERSVVSDGVSEFERFVLTEHMPKQDIFGDKHCSTCYDSEYGENLEWPCEVLFSFSHVTTIPMPPRPVRDA